MLKRELVVISDVDRYIDTVDDISEFLCDFHNHEDYGEQTIRITVSIEVVSEAESRESDEG